MDDERSFAYPILHHRDLVSTAGGRQPVRDVNDRLRPVAIRTTGNLLNGVENVLLGMRIEGKLRVGRAAAPEQDTPLTARRGSMSS